jgi:hypothetical protein
MRVSLAIALLVMCGSAGAQRKLDDEQAKLVEDARAEALSYTS